MRISYLFTALLAVWLVGCAPTNSQINTQGNTSINKSEHAKIVATQYGLIEGEVHNGVSRFLGVPYAVVTKRFVRASAPKAWDGIKEAKSYGPRSPQAGIPGIEFHDSQENTSDNCTTLNIWTPKTGDHGKRPVMVWLHGGGLTLGSANEPLYDGEDLSSSGDVVVVSVNHRLNVFGFLDLSAYGEEYRESANLGIWDLIDALTWIKHNIEAFGGDPDNVTLFGQSGGGTKGLALMSSPYAKGLFSKVIVQSGASETMGVRLGSKKAGVRLAEHVFENLGIDKGDVKKLSIVKPEDLMNAGVKALRQTGEDFKIPAALGNAYSMDFVPEVDGDFLPTDPVTTDGFAKDAKDIALMIGSNLNEWSGYFEQEPIHESSELKKAITQAYPDKPGLTADMIDASLIRLPLIKIMTHKARQHGAKVFSYIFSYGKSNHGAELPYVFNHVHDTKEHDELSRMISSAWVNFAKNGTPSAPGMPTWEEFTEEQGATMIFDTTPVVRYHHDRELMQLLNPAYRLFEGEVVKSSDRLNFPLGQRVEAERFSGTVYISNMIKKDDPSGFAVTNNVIFEPGVHSAWHRHGGMIVMNTGGIGLYQEEGKAVQILHPGDVVEIKEGVRHWHGAAPNSWFSQLVIYDSTYKAQVEKDIVFADYSKLDLEKDNIKTQNSILDVSFKTSAEPLVTPNFTGKVFVSSVVEKPNPAGIPPVHYVAFDKGVINKWHSHEGGQLLIVTDGAGYHQLEGEKLDRLTPGSVVYCPPGVKHWHGAAKGQVFGHLATSGNAQKKQVTWYDFPSQDGL